jgi:hypothetical protein
VLAKVDSHSGETERVWTELVRGPRSIHLFYELLNTIVLLYTTFVYGHASLYSHLNLRNQLPGLHIPRTQCTASTDHDHTAIQRNRIREPCHLLCGRTGRSEDVARDGRTDEDGQSLETWGNIHGKYRFENRRRKQTYQIAVRSKFPSLPGVPDPSRLAPHRHSAMRRFRRSSRRRRRRR